MAGAFGIASSETAPLIAYLDRQITRGALAERGAALAALITAEGVSRLMVLSDDPLHILRAIDGAARAGADLFIAHTNLPEAEIESIKQQFAIQLIVGEADALTAISTEGQPPAGRIFMMTSGTTGAPKIAAHSLGALLSRAQAGASKASPGAKWLLTYQPTGFAGLQVQLTAAITGGVIVTPNERTPSGFLEAARTGGVTQISATPTFWRSFLMTMRPGDLALRQITLGGEAADQSTLDRVRKAFPDARVTHIYASTEAGVVFSVHDGLEGFPAAWLESAHQGAELRVRDGFLHIRTPNAMRNYVSDTPQPIQDDGWLATADRVEIRGERAYIVGRDDSTINVGGSKVYPLAIEQFLLQQPGVLEARVFGQPNPISGFLVAAEVVIEPSLDPAATRSAILAACREALASYQAPRVFKVVDAIAVRASGKKG
ncbi:MAG: acyl--CoA ligase [Terricaulis sp.]|nr:acyl--CoA ligase [Terricaulis sp.]